MDPPVRQTLPDAPDPAPSSGGAVQFGRSAKTAEVATRADLVRLGPSAAGRCRRRIHLDAVDPERRTVFTSAAKRAYDDLAEHRERVFRQIRAEHRIAEPGPGSRPQGRGPQGSGLQSSGSLGSAGSGSSGFASSGDWSVPPDVMSWQHTPQDLVLAPDMTTGSRSGSADLLLWAGDGYVPVIIRAHRTRDGGAAAPCSTLLLPLRVRADPAHRARRNRADRLALAHHYRQLVELGCASATARGGVIGRGSPTDGAGRADTIGGEDDAAVIVWHDLGAPAGSASPGAANAMLPASDQGAGSQAAVSPAAVIPASANPASASRAAGGTPLSPLADYDQRFADRVAVATAAVTGAEPLAWPSRIAECRRCPWWPRCSAELQESADISLLLTGDDVSAARSADIQTIPDLAQLPREALLALPFTVVKPGQAQIRARAWQQGAALVRVSARSAVSRADVEIDVDAESYGEDGAYLWGAQLSGADVGLPAGYRSFVTWEHLPTPAQGEVFGSFFGHLMQVRDAAAARGLSFAVFCYAKAAEERWMLGLARRYADLAGVPEARAVAAFCASPQWIDLMQEIKRQFVLPGSLRLKELAATAGFAWRDPEPGGENSMAWYRAATGVDPAGPPGSGAPSDPAAELVLPRNLMADRVIRYNEDDVRATLALRRWITEHLNELPMIADLDREP